MTMEVILSTAFGRAVDVQGGKGGKLYEAAAVLIRDLTSGSGIGIKIVVFAQFLSCTYISSFNNMF